MSNPPTDDIYLRGGKVIQAEVNGKSLVVNKVKSGSYTLPVKLACFRQIDRSFYINNGIL